MDSYREIENLYSDYAYFIDTGNLDAVAQLFTHGVFVFPPGDIDNPNNPRSHGRQGTRKHLSAIRLYDDSTPKTNHVTTNIWIEVDEDAGTARGRAYLTCMQQALEENFPLQPIATVIYEDTFKKIDGKWWFATRRVTQPRHQDYSRHLTSEFNVQHSLPGSS